MTNPDPRGDSSDALVGAGASLGFTGLLAVLALVAEPGTRAYGKYHGGLALLSVMVLLIAALHFYTSRPGALGPSAAPATPWVARFRMAMVTVPVAFLLFVVDYEAFTFDAVGAGLNVLVGVLMVCAIVLGKRFLARR